MRRERFFPLIPETVHDDDWCRGSVPANLEVGENSVYDSCHCFRQYYSTLPVGLKVGRNVTLWRTSLAVEENGYLEIGDDTFIANASLVSNRRIVIGARCMISGGVTITDSEFHSKSPTVRLADFVALGPRGDRNHRPRVGSDPVVIGSDVSIGWNAVVLKGVKIGDGATVAPCAVVLRDVPSGAIAVGNPAIIESKNEDSRHA